MSDKPVVRVEIPSQYAVVWRVNRNGTHAIEYGKQIESFRKAEDLRAAESFGHAVRHAMECAGFFER